MPQTMLAMLSRALLPLMLVGCSVFAGNPKKPKDQPKGIRFPLAFLNKDFLGISATYVNKRTTATFDQLQEQPRSSTEIDQAPQEFAVAVSVVSMPSIASGQMAALLTSIQNLQVSLFGPEGFFKAQDVDLDEGNQPVTFHLFDAPLGKPEYIVLSYLGEAEAYRFAVDIYARQAAGLLERTTRMEFTPLGTSEEVRVHVLHAGQPSASGSRQMVDVHYDTAQRVVEATFGLKDPVATEPARTVMRLEQSADHASFNLTGAYVWSRPAAEVAGLLPRYYDLAQGDVELFKSFVELTDTVRTAQATAFLPADRVGSVGSTPENSVFVDYSYASTMRAFLTGVIRNLDVNSGCASSGAAFRSLFSDSTIPSSVALLPDDLCAANTAVTDSQVAAAVDAVCGADKDLVLLVATEADSSATREYSICDRQAETVLLANPQYLRVEGQANKIILPPEAPDASHLAMKDRLDALTPIDFSTLSGAWEELPTKADTEFGVAK